MWSSRFHSYCSHHIGLQRHVEHVDLMAPIPAGFLWCGIPLKELQNQLPNVSRLPMVPMVPPRLMHFLLLHKDGALAYIIYIYAQWLSIVDFKESPWSLCLLSHPVKRRSVDQSIKYDPSMVLISSDRLEVKILMAPDGSWGSSGCRRISWCLDTWKGH